MLQRNCGAVSVRSKNECLILLSTESDKVICPPKRDLSADVSSVSPSL